MQGGWVEPEARKACLGYGTRRMDGSRGLVLGKRERGVSGFCETGQNKKATGLSFLIFVFFFFSLFLLSALGGLSFPFLRTNPDSLAWEVGVVFFFGCWYWNEITVAHVLFPGRRGIVMGAVQVMVFRFTTQVKRR